MIIYSTISVNLFANKASSHFISIGREQHTIPLLERCGGDSEPVSRNKEAPSPEVRLHILER